MGIDHIINQSICWAANTDSLIVSHNKITIVFLSEIICIQINKWDQTWKANNWFYLVLIIYILVVYNK